MTGEGESREPGEGPEARRVRSDRLLAVLEPFERVAVVSHVNPDPDSLASMLGIRELVRARQPGKPVILAVDGMIARAENRAMVELIPIPLTPVGSVAFDRETAVVMVDTQPRTGRRSSESAVPHVVIDHHETGGDLDGVLFHDVRIHMGASSTIVTGYLLEQDVVVPPNLATALLYGIESETTGYPREASSLDDGATVWLFPRADKDLLARIRNPKLPQSHFATFHRALSNAYLYRDLVVSWCGEVAQPDIVAEVADFFVRFDQVNWVLSAGLFEGGLRLSLRSNDLGWQAGELLREVVDGMGNAGGHDKRAGGLVTLDSPDEPTAERALAVVRGRLMGRLEIDEHRGRHLLQDGQRIEVP